MEVAISELDVVKLVLEFLESRSLHISQVSLERETGVINGSYSDDALFLRQLIVDGQWDAAVDFVEPLSQLADFDRRAFLYQIGRHKFFELLCIKQEPGPLHNNDFTVQELVEVLKELEELCPSQEEYRKLCALLTLPKLSDHADFKNWNPSSARVECFLKVYPLVKKFLPSPTASASLSASQLGGAAAANDRLFQLVVKGLFYESCVDYCQGQAVSDKDMVGGPKLPRVLESRPKLASADLSLVSWVQALTGDQFTLPFEQRALELKVDGLRKPMLAACWTEQILATPVKPANVFPHAAVPSTRLRSAEHMSRSMLPQANLAGSYMVGARPAAAAMSQSSVAGGFQIQPSVPSAGHSAAVALQQSQIDFLFETSDQTRSTAGVFQQPPQQPYPALPAPSGAPMLNQQPAVPMAPLMQLAAESPRQQLEEMARRSLPPNLPSHHAAAAATLAPVAEVDGEQASGGRLFHQFNSRQPRQSSLPPSLPQPPQPPPQPQMDAMAYQMMQMSMHAQQQQQAMQQQPQFVAPPPRQPHDYAIPHAAAPPVQAAASDYAPRKLHYSMQQQPQSSTASAANGANGAAAAAAAGMAKNVQFVAISRVEDSQAIRAVAFHPGGRYFAVGTNSKQLHLCKYPDTRKLSQEQATRAPEMLLTRPKQHRGSVYCVGFNPTGELLASGSNDKSIRLMGFNADSCKIGAEVELTMHDGTVRDLVFMEDTSNRTSLLISGGAGNCHIHLTDCATGQALRAIQGHSAPILGLYTWGGCMFVSCSQDKTIRFWDLRCQQAVNVIAPGNRTASSPVTSVAMEPGGRLLASGHEDASIMLYDTAANRVVQNFRPHGDEVRTVRFSPGTYYLLSGSYDNKVVITDMRGDLMTPLMYLPVAEHHDKVIQCRWHPHDFSFLSTSADRSAVLWALPPPQ